MLHPDEIIQHVDDTLERHIISEMNRLLITLSQDNRLSPEERYIQQQRLRTAIAQKGTAHSHKEQDETHRDPLPRAGERL